MRRAQKGFWWVNLSLTLILAGSTMTPLRAQVVSGTIYGTVSDAAGARIPGATVTIVNQTTNAQKTFTTGPEGNYIATPLPIGNYKVQASMTGFQPAEVAELVLELQDRREVNFTLQLATVTQQVQVTAQAPLLERTVSSLGQVIHEQNIVDLPLNGRDFVQLGTLSPGATKSEGTQFNNPSASTSARGTTSLTVNGMRENSNDWILDGVDNNELTAGSISILPSIDAIEEFRVMTNNYSAQYGRNGGGTVLLTTKSGSNALHGTLFEFVRNDVFDARNFFDAKKATFRQNQFGDSLGGPIKKDKVFFFGDYQGTRIRKELTFLSTVPTMKARGGDFTEPGQRQIFDPCSAFDNATQTCTAFNQGSRTQFQFQGVPNVIPPNRLDPIATKLLTFYPPPNRPGLVNNFLFDSKREVNDNQFDLRVDHNISASDSYFVRFSFDNAHQFFPGPLPGFGGGTSPFVSATINEPQARNVAVVENHVFSPSLVNQFLAGFNRIFITVVGPSFGQNVSQQIGIPGANICGQFCSGLTRVDLTSEGFNGLGDRLFTPLLLGTNVFQFSDNLTYIHGRHTLNFGFGVRIQQLNSTGVNAPRGALQFNNLFTAQRSGGGFQGGTGSAVASLLLGLPVQVQRSNLFGGTVYGRRWKDYRPYIQDDWNISPNLTLNLGLAYQLITAPTEEHNRFANLDLATGKILVAGKNLSDTGGVRTDTNNLQPRVGFAYSPFGRKKFVIRGGYGIFSDWAQGGLQGLNLNPPFLDEPQSNSNSITPIRLLRDGFPAPLQQDPNNPSGNVVFQPPDSVLGFVQQWNFTLQQELPSSTVVTVAYVGTKGDHLLSKDGTFNSPAPGAGTIGPRRPFPNLGTIIAVLSRGNSTYEGLQTKVEKRFSNGLYLLAGYTWSKSIGNEPAENLTFQPNATGATFFPFAPEKNADKGLASIDLRHSFTLSYLYQLPFGHGRRFLSNASSVANQVFGGWEISGITRIRSGFPLGATIVPSLLNNTMPNRPNVVPGCNPNHSGADPVKRFFDITCFTPPPNFVFGNSGRTFGSGPSQVNFDFSVHKDFQFEAQRALQFRAEMFNIFNHPQFDLPSTSIGTAGAGIITATINDPRVIQFALKLVF